MPGGHAVDRDILHHVRRFHLGIPGGKLFLYRVVQFIIGSFTAAEDINFVLAVHLRITAVVSLRAVEELDGVLKIARNHGFGAGGQRRRKREREREHKHGNEQKAFELHDGSSFRICEIRNLLDTLYHIFVTLQTFRNTFPFARKICYTAL